MYKKRRSNILESSNHSYLSSCLYNEDSDPFCPIFKLETIAEMAGENYTR
jgi:predicted metal-binding protein